MLAHVVATTVISLIGASPAEPPRTMLRSTGIGRAAPHITGVRARLMAERAAQVVTMRDLLAKRQEIEGGRASQSPVTTRGRVQGHRFLPTVFRDDGAAEVTAEWVID